MAFFSQYFGDNVDQGVPLAGQVANTGGGHSWAVDDWTRLDRFLVLGTEAGTYYIDEQKLTMENADAVRRCIASDGPRAVARIAAVSDAGRAPKNEPAIFALAMAAKLGDDATRAAARLAVPKVCRIGTHLMQFAEYIQAFSPTGGGWGRGTRRAIAQWFTVDDVAKLAYQSVKYQSREGWSTRDLLRLAHPKAPTPAHAALYEWASRGVLPKMPDAPSAGDGAPDDALDVAKLEWMKVADQLQILYRFEALKQATIPADVARIIRASGMPREAVPTQWLKEPTVWEALLERMPLNALVRNLATMTRIGLIAPGSDAAREVMNRLGDASAIVRARLHPVSVLAALLTYRRGHGARSDTTWTPVQMVTDALDAAFYAAFGAVKPSGKRIMIGLDVSGSMTSPELGKVPGMTPRIGSVAMCLVTAATEKDTTIMAFSASLTPAPISPRMRLDDACRAVDQMPFSHTDCSLPFTWAAKNKRSFDTFVVYTDSETNALGSPHAASALRAYRQASGIAARLVVVGMNSNGFSIADPNDAGMLDVVGFDTAAPQVISDFAGAS